MTDQVLSGLGEALFGSTGPRGGQHQGLAQVMVKSAVRNIGSAVGREIVRGVMGSILGGRKVSVRRSHLELHGEGINWRQ